MWRRYPATTNKQQNDWEKKKTTINKAVESECQIEARDIDAYTLDVSRSRILAAISTKCAFSVALTHLCYVVRICFVWWCYTIRFTCRVDTAAIDSSWLLSCCYFRGLCRIAGAYTCWYYGRRYFFLWIAWAL